LSSFHFRKSDGLLDCRTSTVEEWVERKIEECISIHNSEEVMEHVLDGFWRDSLVLIAVVTKALRGTIIGDRKRVEALICALALVRHLRL
jgi:hypothetical protein